jgi:DNA (cytosine-5)-methyltransferase 1
MRCIELFAGCGGLALGLHRSGWEGAFAIERDPMAFETLVQNMLRQDAPYRAFEAWPDWLPQQNLDLIGVLDDPSMRRCLTALRGTVDLVAGGPPCQGFSVGGRRDGGDERNSLVYRMIDFVSLTEPNAVLIENVEGIARRFVSKPGQGGMSVADDAISRLESMGYTAAFEVVDASDFGVPQARRRVAIIGVRRAQISAKQLELLASRALRDAAKEVRRRHGLPADRPITVREAISDLAGAKRIPCPDSSGFEAGTYIVPRSRYAQVMREGLSPEALPDSHRFSKHGPEIQRLYKLAHRTQPEGRLSKTFLLKNGTKKDKKVLLDPDSVVSTITTHPDEFIHYLHPRNITVREMARLQSFPDQFTFHGRYTINGPRRRFDVARCSQVGNAVPPLMGEGIGLALFTVMVEARNPKSACSTDDKDTPLLYQVALA